MRTWFLNLRTGTKLLLAFSAALLIAVLVGLGGFASVEGLYAEAQRVNLLTRGVQNAVVKFRLTAENTNRFLFKREPTTTDAESPRTSDRELTASEREVLERQVRTLLELGKVIGRGRDTILQVSQEEAGRSGRTESGTEGGLAEGQNRHARLVKALGDFEEHLPVLARLVPAPGEADAGRPVMFAAAQKAVGELLQDSMAVEGGLDAIATAALHRMDTTREWGRLLMLGGAAVGALLALLVGVITTRMIVNPLREMTAAAQRISEGDLSGDILHASRDEVGGLADSFRQMQGALRDLSAEAQRVAGGDLTRSVRGGGQLGESFNRMVESLSALLREIQEAGTQVKSSSTALHGGLQRNAEASREEAAAVEAVQGSIERLSEAARSIATGASDVERTAGDAARVASQGTASVGSALEGMFRTRERVNEIAQKTMVLGEKCRRIGEVLKIIRDVAGEIHMLALNAAIEAAASAGEHGKRFTVVAAEVRRLAERTRQSAEEIRSILIEIQEAAEATVAAAESGAKEVEAGSAVATSARTAMEEVIGRIHQTAEVARTISRDTQEQRRSSEQVAASMKDISRAVRRMAEGTEESTRAVRDLTDLSERFGDLMGTFRTG